ncbi:cytochrome b/b6 domain-containing protein [Hydrogenimonas sp.]
MKRTIWPLPTRLFHWGLVAGLLGSWLSTLDESLLDVHAAVGYGVGAVVVFRWIWGFVGPRHARFCDWPLDREAFVAFWRDPAGEAERYAGHNPAASRVMLSILVVTTFVAASGLLLYGVQEGKGVAGGWNVSWFQKMDLFETLHLVAAYALFVPVAAHLGGVALESLRHPERGTLRSMIDGKKRVRGERGVRLTPLQKGVATLSLGVAVALPLLALSGATPLTRSVYTPVDYSKEYPLFAGECGSCHTLYPPHLLPSSSWRRVMEGLEDHFGDDASIDEADRRSILAYLVRNGAETGTMEASWRFLKSVREHPELDIIAMTQTAYWKRKHKAIDPALFTAPKIRSRANCKACHRRIEEGLLHDDQIAIPTHEGAV